MLTSLWVSRAVLVSARLNHEYVVSYRVGRASAHHGWPPSHVCGSAGQGLIYWDNWALLRVSLACTRLSQPSFWPAQACSQVSWAYSHGHLREARKWKHAGIFFQASSFITFVNISRAKASHTPSSESEWEEPTKLKGKGWEYWGPVFGALMTSTYPPALHHPQH